MASPPVRIAAPCRRCRAQLSYLDLLDGLRCDTCTDMALRRLDTPTARMTPDPPGPVLRTLALLFAFFVGGVLWALLLLGGQAATCAAWGGQLTYCSTHGAGGWPW